MVTHNRFLGALVIALSFCSQAHAGYDNVSANSDGLRVLTSSHDTCVSANGFSIAVSYIPETDVEGTEFWAKAVAIAIPGNSNPSLGALTWEINVWNSDLSLHHSPFHSNFYRREFALPDLGSVFIPTGYDNNNRAVFTIGFTLDGLALQAGNQYWISLRALYSNGGYPTCSPATGYAAIQASGACPSPADGGNGKIFSENTAYWPPSNWEYTQNVLTAPAGCKQMATKLNTTSISILGDMNCDGIANFADIIPFRTALFSPAEYRAAFPDCSMLSGDFNGNGYIDPLDVDPFHATITP